MMQSNSIECLLRWQSFIMTDMLARNKYKVFQQYNNPRNVMYLFMFLFLE